MIPSGLRVINDGRGSQWFLAGMFAFLILLGAGCESRDRGNPFDPENPGTDGTPTLLRALASDSSVVLRWDIPEFEDADGLRILREVAGDPPTEIYLQTEATAGEWIDSPVSNGVYLLYHLEILDPDGVWLPTVPDGARPGPARIWVGDAAGGGLKQIAPDGEDVLARIDSGDFLDVAVEPDGTVWAPNWSRGEILSVHPGGEPALRFDHRGGNAVAIDELTSEVWIGSFNFGSLSRYSRDGSLVRVFEELGPIEDIEAQRDREGGVWLAARSLGVTQFGLDSTGQHWDAFQWPVSLVDDALGSLWVVDRAEPMVYRIDLASGESRPSSATFADPVDSTGDGKGGLWIADPGRGGLIHIDRDGTELAYLAVGVATGVTYDVSGDLLWVVFRSRGVVSALRPDGTERSSVSVGGRPVKVEGNW